MLVKQTNKQNHKPNKQGKKPNKKQEQKVIYQPQQVNSQGKYHKPFISIKFMGIIHRIGSAKINQYWNSAVLENINLGKDMQNFLFKMKYIIERFKHQKMQK